MKTPRHRLNYNEIAHLFDEPIRDHDVDPNLLAYFEQHPQLNLAETAVLDIGCGTGKQLAADRTRFPETQMVGLDPFEKMLEIARQRCNTVAWVKGEGANLPFPAHRFHYATNQFSYAHIRQKEPFIREVFRVLKENGRFVMTNIDPWRMTNWIIYRYFPAAWELDNRDFLPMERFVALMQEAGFVNVTVKRDHRLVSENLSQFLAYVSQRHRTSEFMAISDRDYQDGLKQIQAELAQDGEKVVESEVCLVTAVGDKP